MFGDPADGERAKKEKPQMTSALAPMRVILAPERRRAQHVEVRV
jgi:hypothetical protein